MRVELDEELLAKEIASRLDEAITAELVQRLVSHALIGMDAACQYLGTGRTWMKEATREGKIRSVRIGNRRMFRLEWLDEFVESQK